MSVRRELPRIIVNRLRGFRLGKPQRLSSAATVVCCRSTTSDGGIRKTEKTTREVF
jgi:hypothetical protein